MASELISKKTRTEFCEHLVGWTLRTIRNEFDSADITCDEAYQPPVSGERRTLVMRYYHTLDFSKPNDIQRVLLAYESILNAEYEKLETLEAFNDEAKAAGTIRMILGNLATLSNGMAELRNQLGTGHGRTAASGAARPRHARLAVGAATTLAVFLYETHQERVSGT